MGFLRTFDEIIQDENRSRFSKVIDATVLVVVWTAALGATIAAVLRWQLWPAAVLLWGLAIILTFRSWYASPRRSKRALRRIELEERLAALERAEAEAQANAAEAGIEARVGSRSVGAPPAPDPWEGEPAPH